MESLDRGLSPSQMRFKRRWQVIGGIAWTLCYIWLICEGLRTRKWYLPFFSNICFWAHEMKSIYVCSWVYSPMQRIFTLLWVVLDAFVILNFVKFADKQDYPFVILNILSLSPFWITAIFTVILSVVMRMIDRYFNDHRGVRTGFVLCILLPLEDILSRILFPPSKTYCGLQTVGCVLTLLGNFGYWIGYRHQAKHWKFVRRVGHVFLSLQIFELIMAMRDV